jgi:hypothetical protein
MTPVDYQGIRDEIEAILQADERTRDARIYVEEEPQFGLGDNQKAIAVFMETRSTPENMQSLSEGRRTRMNLKVTCWVIAFHLESFRKACDERDSLLNKVELVLMDNRTLNNKVSTSWLIGGELFSGRNRQDTVFTSVAEVVLMLDVSAINT